MSTASEVTRNVGAKAVTHCVFDRCFVYQREQPIAVGHPTRGQLSREDAVFLGPASIRRSLPR